MTIQPICITKEQNVHFGTGIGDQEFLANVANGKVSYISCLSSEKPLACEILNYITFLQQVLEAITNTIITDKGGGV